MGVCMLAQSEVSRVGRSRSQRTGGGRVKEGGEARDSPIERDAL